MSKSTKTPAITPKGVTLKAVGNQAKETIMPIVGMGVDVLVTRKMNKDSLMFHGVKTGVLVLGQFVPAIPKWVKNIMAGAAVSSTLSLGHKVLASGKIPSKVADPVKQLLPEVSAAEGVAGLNGGITDGDVQRVLATAAVNQPINTSPAKVASEGSMYGWGGSPMSALNGGVDSSFAYNIN